ncbi:MAG: hypothetical protein ABSD68_02855 [Candidatus Micrarchaeales archaeon]|jgi:hypothetical protein
MSSAGEKTVEMKSNVIPSTTDREKAYEHILLFWPLETKFYPSRDHDSITDFQSAQSALRKVKEEIKSGSLEKAKTGFDNFIEFVNREPKAAGIYKDCIKDFEAAQQNFDDFAKYMLEKEKMDAAKIEAAKKQPETKKSIFPWRRH